MGLRDLVHRYLPSWLGDHYPEKPSWGFRVVWSVGLLVDTHIETALAGSFAAVGRGTPTALKYIGEARGIERGRLDTDESYAAKLRTWIDRHKERGHQRRLALEIHEYLGATKVRVINRHHHWITVDTDGTVSETDATFDWDSVSHPERHDPDEPWFSDLFVVIYSPFAVRPGTFATLTADSYALGHRIKLSEVDALKRILLYWRSANSCVRAVIWTDDPTQFDPTEPASCPDGTWGAWSTRGSGSRVASARFTNCRFWEPR